MKREKEKINLLELLLCMALKRAASCRWMRMDDPVRATAGRSMPAVARIGRGDGNENGMAG